VIEVGAAGWGSHSGFRFEVRETGRRVRTEFFTEMDDFAVRVVDSPRPGSRELPKAAEVTHASE
jgi:hypothetical protein